MVLLGLVIVVVVVYAREQSGGDIVPWTPIQPTIMREFSFLANGYLRVKPGTFRPGRGDFTLSLAIKTTVRNAYILSINSPKEPYATTEADLELYLRQSNTVIFRVGVWETHSEDRVFLIGDDHPVADGRWHDIVVSRRGDEWKLMVDATVAAHEVKPFPLALPDTEIHIGSQAVPFHVDYVKPFEGCMRNINLNGNTNFSWLAVGKAYPYCLSM